MRFYVNKKDLKSEIQVDKTMLRKKRLTIIQNHVYILENARFWG